MMIRCTVHTYGAIYYVLRVYGFLDPAYAVPLSNLILKISRSCVCSTIIYCILQYTKQLQSDRAEKVAVDPVRYRISK
jgi:hypothetical protein